ncbi:MAG: hypothetical protein QM742_06585 [Aquabacterium sp.]
MELPYPGKFVSFNGFGPDAYATDGVLGLEDPAYARRILCEGDSWFTIGAVPSSNLLYPLRFAQSTLLVSLARPGDTIRNMCDIAANPTLKQLIAQQNFAVKWDAIFISGGGNDLIDKASNIICRPSAGAGQHMLDYINMIDLTNFKRDIMRGYFKIAELRQGSVNEKTPIVTHVYDYPTPRDAKSKFLGFKVGGPWLYPAFKQHDVPEAFWISLTDFIFEALASTLVELSFKIPHFHTISNTREVLTRARLGTTESDGDWLNEIHPTQSGYEKLSRVISPELNALATGTHPDLC